ncbi:rRNA-processing protein utp21, partial [Spiromyces aspiralis]
MASANADGDISLWDLDERRLIHVMRGAHDGLIPSIDFLRKQPILLSSGADNAVKEWIFDSLDGVPRLLKQRSGHYGPPQSIRYYGEDGRVILSAGRDQALRYFSVTRDSQNVELSQGSLERAAKLKRMNVRDLRLPCITQFSADPARQKDWDNILTCHLNDPRVFTWSIKRKAIGKHAIPLNDGAIAKAVAVSACGNFGFIGTSAGYVDVINMQSGRHRKRLEGHERTVTAVQCDRINHFVYTAGLDKTVKVWDFATSKLIASIQLPSSVSTLLLHRDSDLLAAACDDMVIRVIDAESHKVVRLFAGHENRITDIAFSPDGRWLVSASLDGTIRTWDLPTGYMIDGFRVPSVPISLAFSPTGDFLATSHMDSPGIFLWSNRTQFTGIDIQPIRGEDLAAASLPTSAMGHDEDDSKDSGEAEAREQERLAATETSMYLTPEKLTEDLVTLSSMPKSKWQTLLNLEIIKKRNKPKEPPKAPEKAPFFLPSVRDMSKGFAENDGDDGAEDAELRARFGAGDGPVKSSIHTTSGGGLASIKTALSLKLEKAAQTKDYAPVMNYLQSLNPSGVDYELRSLTVDSNLTDFVAFLEMLDHHLATKRDFELVQVYLNVFLRIHSDIITNNPE